MSSMSHLKRRPLFSRPAPKKISEAKWKKAFGIIWVALKRTCMVMGAAVLISAIFGIYMAYKFTPSAPPSLPDEMVLYLNLEEGLDEMPQSAGFADPFAMPKPTLQQTINALDAAAKDKRVNGLIARLRGGSYSIAHLQELREAVKRFRGSGKFAYIYATSYGDGSGSLGPYYLASAFDEIWMQPMGTLSITGVSMEMPFFKGLLDKIGVTPLFFQREEYKTAYENLMRTEMSPENKQMLATLLDDFEEEVTNGILETAASQNIPDRRALERLINEGLFTAPEALKSGLITHADYADAMLDKVREEVTGDPDDEDLAFVALANYGARAARKAVHAIGRKPKVALVYAVGPIVEDNPGHAMNIAASSEIAPAIFDAAEDESVKAIVLRIDSPGGSPVASESILRALRQAQAKGKPVIVSMGPAAASGGYWIASHADHIFTMPTTITGSIGVIGGKFTVTGLSQKLGVTWDRSLKRGENAALWSPVSPFNESEAREVNAMLDHVYDSFLTRVSEGRGMDYEAVKQVAGGRVWSGKRAVEIGLADKLGGLNEALDYAVRQAGGKDRHDMAVVIVPAPKTPLEQLLAFLEGQSVIGPFLKNLVSMAQDFEKIAGMLPLFQQQNAAYIYEPLRIE